MDYRIWILSILLGISTANHHHPHVLKAVGKDLSDIDIECNSNNIQVTISTQDDFNGMIYPKGLSKNSSCLAEYEHAGSKITYRLPLRSCNTMSHDTNDGVEYFNTVVIQPHHKLVTSLGKGFHVRCRYQTKNKTLGSDVGVKFYLNIKEIGVSESGIILGFSLGERLPTAEDQNLPFAIGTTKMVQETPLPNCVMKIYVGRPDEHILAEHVKIGDYLTLVITIDHQEIYGLKVTNCLVRDGLSWSEQPLINNDGCQVDEDIMGPFEYSKNLTEAHVTFPAHKFPFTSSVYYQCNVKLCLKHNGGCEDAPPICDATGHNVRRRRRKRQSGDQVEDQGSLTDLRLQDEDVRDRSVDVYSGLYVNELGDLEDESDAPSSLPARSDDDFCVSVRKFAIGIAIAGVLLMLAVILLVACIVHRRRRRKGSSTAGSSIYSGPYSNHAYSRD